MEAPTAPTQAENTSAPIDAEPANPREGHADLAPVLKKRKRYFSEFETPRPKRRSARLSGEKVQPLPPDAVPQTPKVVQEATVRKEEPKSREDEPNLHAEKKRLTTKIALPFADTPVITRNKEMRKNSGGHRRSSTGLRGRRASSLIESGTSNGKHMRPCAIQQHADRYSTSAP